ncbi:glycosyltransferase [Herbiconiux daphne]|uniref:Glycosyltransferase n=1 Tax=Herbiconiux daphne TaxID=2970914 RepID=A0ABT2H6M8_9MICO|nr:glycosyltransferase [Herbiconiux daphne]MCS5735592.1 glycosyltransferase [Herbiconiux daphne]
MTQQRKVGVILGFGFSPETWRLRYAKGEVADETPYAYHLAEEWFALEWSTDRVEGHLSRWWRMSVKRFVGFDFVHVWRNRHVIKRVDAVWTHTEREHLAVALIKALAPRRYRAVSIAQSVWLWDLWPGISGLRARVFRSLLRRHAVELVLSRVNRDDSRRLVPGRKVLRLPFGSRFATPAPTDAALPTPPRVLVVGNDRHRDWDLLLEVTRLVPEADFDIISLASTVRERTWPSNVHVRSSPQRLVLEAYASSSIAALPLRDNHHASGCTVAIEAISAGIPLIVSDAGGIDEYVTDADAALVPVGDAQAFATALRARLARNTRAEGGLAVATSRGLAENDYITRLALLTLAVLDHEEIDGAVEAFRSPPSPTLVTENKEAAA